MSQFQGMATGGPSMSAFVSTPGLPPSARSQSHYTPRNPQELRQYETLWSAASPAGTPLQGAQAVQFFQRSGLEITALKSVREDASCKVLCSEFFGCWKKWMALICMCVLNPNQVWSIA